MVNGVSRSIVTLLLVAVLGLVSAGALAAEPVTITFATWAFPGPLLDATKAAVEAFEELHPNIKVEIVSVPCCRADVTEKYIVQIAAGTAPDIMEIPFTELAAMAENGFLLPLDSMIEMDQSEVDPADIFPPAWDAVTHRGQRYGLPIDLSVQWMAFRPEVFEEAGLSDPHHHYRSGTWTWDTLRDAAKKLTIRHDSGVLQQAGFIIQYSELLGQPWLYQTGSTPFSEDLGRSNLTDPRVIEALNYLREIAIEDQALFDAWTSVAADPKNGTFGVWPQWLSIPYFFQGSPFQIDIVPYVSGTVTDVTTAQIHSISIWSGSKHPKEAWEFVKFITGDGSHGHIAAGIPPVRRSLFPLFSDKIQGEFGIQGLQFFHQDVTRMRVFQITPEWAEVERTIILGLGPVWANEEDLHSAVIRTDAEVNAILSR